MPSPHRDAWITPPNVPADYVCRRILIPNQTWLVAAVNGALQALTLDFNWEQVAGVPVDEVLPVMQSMYNNYLESDFCMLGAIMPMARDQLPDFMLWCDGSVYSKNDYPKLYEVIAAELILDTESFMVPDLRNQFVFGAQDDLDVMDTGGAASVTLTTDEMPEHTHSTQPHDHSTVPHSHTSPPHIHELLIPVTGIDLEGPGVPDPTAVGNPPIPVSTGPASAIIDVSTVDVNPETVTVDNAGGGEAHENMPPYTKIRYAIVAR